jgi:replicative DNA helicase
MENPDRKKDGRHFQLEEVSRGLKALAKDLGIAVLALVQVSREVESRADGMANLSDIKDCGQIEQDADIAMFLDRPIVRKPDSGYDWNHYARLLVAKNRQGKQGVFPLHFDGSKQRFAEWDGAEPTVAVSKPYSKGLR